MAPLAMRTWLREAASSLDGVGAYRFVHCGAAPRDAAVLPLLLPLALTLTLTLALALTLTLTLTLTRTRT